jgi:hypothetical protein
MESAVCRLNYPKPSPRQQGKHCWEIKYLGVLFVALSRRVAHNSAMAEKTSPTGIAPYPLAVVMERVRLSNRWATERWEAKGVVRDETPPGGGHRVIVSDECMTQILFPGFVLRLHADEAEGYIYNITSPQPKVFVLWRMEEEVARPQSLSVSYHEGARWMDAEECVGGVALPPDLLAWIAEFASEHYKPEPKKKVRYASSKDKGVASRRGGDT